MILRAMGAGIVLWLAVMAALRFYGDYFFTPDLAPSMAAFAAVALAFAFIGWLFVRLLLGVQPGDEAEAAIGLAFPGMALGAFVANHFPTIFPGLDETLDGVFGALMLTANAALIFTGVLFTRIAPQDERI